MQHQASQLRLLSDLKAIKQEVCHSWLAAGTIGYDADCYMTLISAATSLSQPPEGCSASPVSDENLDLWTATIFGPEVSGGVALGLLVAFAKGSVHEDRLRPSG